MGLRGDLRLIERAIRQGWQTAPDKQSAAMDLVLSTLDDHQRTPREVAAALRCVDAIIQHEGATSAEIRKRAQDALRRYHRGAMECKGLSDMRQN